MINPAYFVAAGAIVLAGVCYVGMNRAENKAAQAKAQWAEEKSLIEREYSEAMARQIEAQNKTMKELETIHAESQKSRALAAEYAASAVVAGSNAARAERRLRDASATAALAASAAANQAGASDVCKTAAETSRVLNGVLQDLDSLTGRIGSFANTVSRFADESYGAATACERAYEVIR